jgi:hypothetical protein
MHSLGPIGSAAGFLIACDARTAANRLWPLGFFAVGRRGASRSADAWDIFWRSHSLTHAAVTRCSEIGSRSFFGNWHAIRRTKKNLVGCVCSDLIDSYKIIGAFRFGKAF